MSEKHNHVTRDIKPLGQCPACDNYHDRHIPKKSSLERVRDEAAEIYADKIFGIDFDSVPRCNNEGENHIEAFFVGFDKGAEEMAKIKDAQILELGTALESIVGCEADLFGDDIVKALENFRKEVK